MNARAIDMTGITYGELTALRSIGRKPNGNITWQFRCTCGVVCEIEGYSVRVGKVVSCAACGSERARQASLKHGKTETREFATWTDMQTRCHNPNSTSYRDYGGRGIAVCDRWRSSFSAFYADMGPKPSAHYSIERVDVNGNYEPGNCRWATAAEQAANKRNTRRIEINGVTKTLSEWAISSGILASTIHLRLKVGVTGLELLAPSRSGGTLKFNGITDTYAGWSKRTGIKQSTIAMRLTKYGWPVNKALTKGARL